MSICHNLIRQFCGVYRNMAFSLQKVLISDNVAPGCAEILQKNGIAVETKTKLSKDELIKEIQNYDGLIVRSATKVTADVIDAAKNLKIIGRAGTGVDNIDVNAASRQGIIVMNTPGGNTMSAAEHTCCMICSLSRNIPQAHMSMNEGRWDRSKFMGHELYGKTLAIIGLGRIGKEVALRMQSFGMTTIGYDPIIPAKVSAEFGVDWMELEHLWPKADYITVHVPLIPQTKGLIGEKSFPQCKKGVRVVNVARGGVIDESALVTALESGQCGGAALDVFEEEPPTNKALIQNPLVVTTPHLGASTKEAQVRVAVEIAEQFVDAVNGKSLVGALNAPALANALKEETKPWVKVGEGLGVLAAALTGKANSQTEIQLTTYGGELKEAGSFLQAAVCMGLLKEQATSALNLVNAAVFNKEIGIQVNVSHQAEAPATLTAAVSVLIKSNNTTYKLSGTVLGSAPVLCEIDGATFVSAVVLSGNLLLYKSESNGATFCAVTCALKGNSQIMSYSSTAQTDSSMWGAIQLATPLPNVDGVKPHVKNVVQLTI
ncbi:D-3-phosphoglycerate dehydrogenase-like [Amphiura filiformis]|uniref:D-3-phosphoglycerate dehydrogenase-like n=1 Tax=Amphiura filiformis TaxID=82378 RepID=UPI003B21FF7F